MNQPALLDDSQLPVCLPVLESIKDRRYEHQGVRLLEDDAKALRLVELILARWGVKKISREMSISPHTVRAARRALVLQGKLAPYKQRVVEMMEDAIEAGMANYRDALESGQVSAGQIPVGMGIIFDKRALAMGEPTSISQRDTASQDELSEKKLNEYLEQLPTAQTVPQTPPVDSVSTDTAPEPKQIAGEGV